MGTKPTDIVLIGAAGNAGRAFLRLSSMFPRRMSGVAIDAKPMPADVAALAARRGLRVARMDAAGRSGDFSRLLHRMRGCIVVDLTDADTEPLARKVMAHDASYLNTSYCGPGRRLGVAVLRWLKRLPSACRRPHVLFSGMNPGIVNAWAAFGIERHGTPRRLVQFEYDSAALRGDPAAPLLTWSPSHCIAEMVEDASERFGADGKPRYLLPNALAHRRPMRGLLGPFYRARRYPRGCITPHEECATLALRFRVACSYLYALRPQTLRALARDAKHLEVGDNVSEPLLGADSIGMMLDFGDRQVTYFNSLRNEDVKGASATIYQMIVGVYAGLHTLTREFPPAGVYLPEDLAARGYMKFATDHLVTEELVRERKGGRWRTIARGRVRLTR